MIARLIALCARNPAVTIACVLAASAAGAYALLHTPLDAVPDLSDTQVIVSTEWMGRSPTLVESQVTYPLVTALRAVPGVRYVRGLSMLGDSFVYVVFHDGVDLYWARTRVTEALTAQRARLPEGVSPQLGPDATSVGWVFEYALVDTTGRQSLADLRTFQDWTLRYWLQSVDGVAEVASVGGFVKQYQVEVNPERLASYGVRLDDVRTALARSNAEVGGGVAVQAEHEAAVRSAAYLRGVDDIASVALRSDAATGASVRVGDVADVHEGPEPRRGIAELDGRGEVVGGIVVMRQGQNALRVIDAVKQRLNEVQSSLPPGVQVVVTYDRSELIHRATHTLTRTLLEEMAIVSAVIVLFLLHARSALVPILTLPIAVLLAFIPMVLQGVSANIMSLGGIAVAIGAMVDASIIMVENVHRRVDAWESGGRAEPRGGVVIGALTEVGTPIFFALLVITLSFLPIFTLQGTEGRLFRPLALTKTYSMAFAALLAVTLTPALVVLFLRGRMRPESSHPLTRPVTHAYERVVRWALAHRAIVLVGAVLIVVSTVPVFLRLGSEFMPPLNEGVLLYMPTAPPNMSDEAGSRVLQAMDRQIATVPEVERVFGKMGRARTATDPAPLGMVETVITLKPQSEWRPGKTWESIVAELDRLLRVPGMPNIWWMPIQTRNEMLATGVRSPVGVKVYGPDRVGIERVAARVEDALRDVRGTRSAFTERLTGGLYLDVSPDREAVARYGLTSGDVQDAIEAAVGGAPVTQTVSGRERYAIAVRYPRDVRGDADALRRVSLLTPMGAQVPLGALAHVAYRDDAPMIQEEDGSLVAVVSVDVADRALASYVRDAQAAVHDRVTLPPGYRLAWAGQFQYYERARARLLVVVPVTLLLVFALLYMNRRSVTEALIVMLAVPFSLVGAVWLVWALHYNMSVAVWVGMIALAGLDAETGVVMLLYLSLATHARRERGALRTRHDLDHAIVEGAAHRIRPKMMTVAAILFGLVPILWSHGAGADVMRRIAAPMVGGVVTSFVLELVVYPVIYAWWQGRRLPAARAEA